MNGPEDEASHIRALVSAEPVLGDDRPALVGALQRLCRAAGRSLPAEGSAVSVTTADGGPGLCVTSDARAARLEDAQYTLGDGPAPEAFAARRPAMSPDLARDTTRWPAFAPVALAERIASVSAFPMQIGAARLGTFTIYRERAVPLVDGSLQLAMGFADAARDLLLDGQEAVPDGEELFRVTAKLSQIWLAQGMVAVQLRLPVADAWARMRAHAYATNVSVGDLAEDIVARRLTLEPDAS